MASVYIIGCVVAAIVLGLSVFVANGIKFQPDSSDVKSRKTWFWIISFLAPLLTFALAYIMIYSGLKVPAQKQACMIAMCIAAGVSWVIYVILGLVVSKAFKNKKVGNWF